MTSFAFCIIPTSFLWRADVFVSWLIYRPWNYMIVWNLQRKDTKHTYLAFRSPIMSTFSRPIVVVSLHGTCFPYKVDDSRGNWNVASCKEVIFIYSFSYSIYLLCKQLSEHFSTLSRNSNLLAIRFSTVEL